jgi:trehalose-6-phosphate synthase
LRARGVKNAIGFFLHIPWPARELILTLPRHRQLVEALFHYDVVGFHTEEWKNAFNLLRAHEASGMALSDGRAAPLAAQCCRKHFRSASTLPRSQFKNRAGGARKL